MAPPAPLLVLDKPRRLFWSPDVSSEPTINEEVEMISALTLCKAAGADADKDFSGKYYVQHYPVQALGRAFGPLPLDQVISFCHNLGNCLNGIEKPALALGTEQDKDGAARTNAVVLLGAFLIWQMGWTAKDVAAVMPGEAQRAFACSWARADRPEGQRVMKVVDCWDGLEMAYDMGWIKPHCWQTAEDASSWCTFFRHTVGTYDASWFVPNRIMIAADPVTVAADPNPRTCSGLFPPEEGKVSEEQSSEHSLDKPIHQFLPTLPGEPDNLPGMLLSPLEPPSSPQSQLLERRQFGKIQISSPDKGAWSQRHTDPICTPTSVDTVNKDYEMSPDLKCITLLEQEGPVPDYVTFMKKMGITQVVRANFSNEPGMPNNLKSYEIGALKPYGIDQMNIFVVDKDGGMPTLADIARCLEACQHVKEDAAVLIHCKGGFGRSGILACCLAIDRFNLPGRAVLAWARIARSGTITTARQERFLASLKGRADIRRAASLPPHPNDENVSKPRCAPCKVQ